jgi:hypothetical protein
MKSRVVFFVGMLVATTWAGPLKIEPGEVDFGTKGQNLRLEAVVKLTNTSDKDVQIFSVASDCSCTAGEPAQKTLAPGASTTMPLAMETRHYQGALTRRLTIFTSAGSDEVQVKATIRAYEDWEIVPLPVILPTSLRNQEAATAITASYFGAGDITVLGATTDRPWLRADYNLEPGRKGGSVMLRKLAAAPAGQLQAEVTLKTNDPKNPRLVLKVLVPVVSTAKVAPNPIILPTVRAGTTTTREVAVSGWEEATAPSAMLPLGSVEAKGRGPNGDYLFVVTMTPAEAGMSTQMLQLSAEPGAVLIEVPVILKADPK